MNLAMTGRMDQPKIREIVFAPAFLRDHMMSVEPFAIFQMMVADWTNALLPLDELAATIRRHLRFRSPLLPVVL